MAGADGPSTTGTGYLEVIPRIPFRSPDIFPHISPKSQDHVKDDRGTHRQDGSIHKILPDLAGSDPHAVTDGRTNTEGIPFYEAFKSVHTSKVENCPKTSNKALFTASFFVILRQFSYLLKILPWYSISNSSGKFTVNYPLK
jgi:hypothetical protein